METDWGWPSTSEPRDSPIGPAGREWVVQGRGPGWRDGATGRDTATNAGIVDGVGVYMHAQILPLPFSVTPALTIPLVMGIGSGKVLNGMDRFTRLNGRKETVIFSLHTKS